MSNLVKGEKVHKSLGDAKLYKDADGNSVIKKSEATYSMKDAEGNKKSFDGNVKDLEFNHTDANDKRIYKDSSGNSVTQGSKTSYVQIGKDGSISDFKGNPDDLKADTRIKGGNVSEFVRGMDSKFFAKGNADSSVPNETIDDTSSVTKDSSDDTKNPDNKKSGKDNSKDIHNNNSSNKIGESSSPSDTSIPKSGESVKPSFANKTRMKFAKGGGIFVMGAAVADLIATGQLGEAADMIWEGTKDTASKAMSGDITGKDGAAANLSNVLIGNNATQSLASGNYSIAAMQGLINTADGFGSMVDMAASAIVAPFSDKSYAQLRNNDFSITQSGANMVSGVSEWMTTSHGPSGGSGQVPGGSGYSVPHHVQNAFSSPTGSNTINAMSGGYNASDSKNAYNDNTSNVNGTPSEL